MSTLVDFSTVSRAAVEREQKREGVAFDVAVSRVARRIKMGPGTLANIIRQRVKSVSFDVGSSIVTYAINDLTRQIEQLQHERTVLLEMGVGADNRTLGNLARAIATVQETLNEISGASSPDVKN